MLFRSSGLFVKGEHKRQFAYEAHTACDDNGFVVETVVTPGNVHDSVAFDDVYDKVTGSDVYKRQLRGATLVRYYDAVICLNNSANLIKTYKHYMLSANPSKVPQGAFKSGIKILGCSNSN